MIKAHHEIKRPLILAGALILISLALTACGSASVLQGSSWPGMTVDEDTVFISYNEYVYAIDIATGDEIWRFPPESEKNMTFFAPPEVTSDGTIIVGGFDNLVYAISEEDGTSAGRGWPFEGSTDRIVGGSTTLNGTVLVPSTDWNLYPISLESGELTQEPFLADEALWSAPLVDGDMVYVSALDHTLYAFDLSTGGRAWSANLGGAITDTPAIADGMLLAGTFARTMNAIDAENGRILWTFDTEGGVWGNPVIADGVAYFGDDAGVAYAVSLENAREQWRTPLEGPSRASPAVDNGVVYFVTEFGEVEAFDLEDGRPTWRGSTTLDARLLSDPQMSSEGLLVPAMESETDCLLYLIDPEDGDDDCIFKLE